MKLKLLLNMNKIYSLDIDDTVVYTRKYVCNDYFLKLGKEVNWDIKKFNDELDKKICSINLIPTIAFNSLTVDSDTKFIVMSNRPIHHKEFIIKYITKYYPNTPIIDFHLQDKEYFTDETMLDAYKNNNFSLARTLLKNMSETHKLEDGYNNFIKKYMYPTPIICDDSKTVIDFYKEKGYDTIYVK